MSKDEMSHDHITGDFQISQKPYWKLLLQSLLLICILFVAESMVIFLVEKPKYFWIAIVGVIIAFLILKLSKLKLFQFSRITKKQWLIIIIGFILANGADYIYFEFMPTTGNEKELEESYRNVPLYLQLIAIGILGPILEEIIFRGLLIKGIFRGAPIVGGIVSVILFAGAHGPSNIGEWFIYGFSGFIFVIAYLTTKRLEIPIIIHMLGNILAIFQNYFW